MQRKTVIIGTFAVAVALSMVAATTQFGDSAHAMGLISERGGRAHHPVHLPADGDRYTLVVTATVLPPYRGDAAVTVEGPALADVSVRASEPVIDLGLRRRPSFRGHTFYGLEPGDRLALWLLVRRPPADPVCGHLRTTTSICAEHAGETRWFCSPACRRVFLEDPASAGAAREPFSGSYSIVFRNPRTDAEILRIPLILGAGSEGGSGHGH